MFEKLKILELSSVLAGPAVGMFFAELGAQVTKIENKTSNGDLTRKWLLPSEKHDALSAYFCSVNYGKKHLYLDYNDSEDKKTLHQLIASHNVIISNFKAGDAEKFQLQFEVCKKINPKIIYAQIEGFKSNPKRVAFDIVLQAETGFLAMTGDNEHLSKMPVAMIDVLAAHQIKEGILVAMIQQQLDKKAYKVTTTLEESAIASLMNQSSNYLMVNHMAKPIGTLHPNIAPYGDIIITKGGYQLITAIGTNKQFSKFCKIINFKETNAYNSNHKRVSNRKHMINEINKITKKLDHKKLLAACEDHKIPIGKIKKLDEVLNSDLAKKMTLKSKMEGQITKRIQTVAFELSN